MTEVITECAREVAPASETHPVRNVIHREVVSVEKLSAMAETRFANEVHGRAAETLVESPREDRSAHVGERAQLVERVRMLGMLENGFQHPCQACVIQG